MKQEFDFEEAVDDLTKQLAVTHYQLWSPKRVEMFHASLKELLYAVEIFAKDYEAYEHGVTLSIETHQDEVQELRHQISQLKLQATVQRVEASKLSSPGTVEEVAGDWYSSWYQTEPTDSSEDDWYSSVGEDDGFASYVEWTNSEEAAKLLEYEDILSAVEWSSSQKFCSARRSK